jgi:hypothetical protein
MIICADNWSLIILLAEMKEAEREGRVVSVYKKAHLCGG